MKLSLEWLRDFIELELSPEELAKKLLMLGLEVTEIKRLGPNFEGVVVGEILEVGKHPNADRLSLCSVKVGDERLSIVCGAKNVAIGARVPVARIGAKLPGGKIERAKIRGVESQGMICSTDELGLAKNGDGILILPSDAPIGADAAALLGRKDTVLEVEITPNRPDCLSQLGIARELSIHLGRPLKNAAPTTIHSDGKRSREITIQAGDGCTRYIGRDLDGAKIGPSPAWLSQRLESVGARPINNAVDVTNYVLFELGQPMHVFDADKLQGPIVVRRAKAGEKLKALDGKTYSLVEADLVIADDSGPVAIAGVIGGEPTSVGEQTKRILLETAHFDPGTVRRTSARLGVRTDASYRFERGVDVAGAGAAAARAAELLMRLCGGDAKEANDVYPSPKAAAPINVDAGRINRILGSTFEPGQIQAVLKRMAAKTAEMPSGLQFTPPSYRGDLLTIWDLAEEVARHIGYDNVPEDPAPVRPLPVASLPVVELTDSLRERLRAAGFTEAYNTDFISETQLKLLAGAKPVRVLNPLSEDQAYLRPTLLVGLLQNAVYNLSRGREGVRLFEIGRAYHLSPDGRPSERTFVAGVQLGQFPSERHWDEGPKKRELKEHFYEIKGVAEALLAGYPDVERRVGERDALFHPGALVAAVDRAGHELGRYGAIHPSTLKALDLRVEGAAFVFDMDLLAALPRAERRFTPFSPFPSVVRDLSIVVDELTGYAKIEDALGGLENLVDTQLVDVYAGQGIAAGKKSLTLRLTFSRMDRTLRDAEVEGAIAKALDTLKKKCEAALRA